MVQPSPFAFATGMVLCLALAQPVAAWPNPFSRGPKAAPASTQAAPPAGPPTVQDGDASTRRGVLPNGLRYAVVKSTDGGRAALRLRFNVGATAEGPEEQGFTQVLARLPFDHPKPVARARGSAAAPRLKFNADDNADATFDATTFSLDVPTTEAGALDVALEQMRSVAGEPKFSQADADAEWNVVLTHERGNNDVAYRLFKARLAFLLDGQRPALGYVAGKTPLPAKVRRAAVEAFHARYYRPETAILVVVGDADPDEVEASIRAHFGDWRASGPPGPIQDTGPIETRGMQARLFTEEGAPSTIQISWIAPPDHSTDSPARRRGEAIERLALAILNRRLDDLVGGEGSPMDSAAALRADQFGAARVMSLIIGTSPDRWRKAIEAADAVRRAATTWGVTTEELARARAAVEAELKDAIDRSSDRTAANQADALVTSLALDQASMSPAESLSLFDQVTADVTTDQVSAAIKGFFEGQGPLVFMSSPKTIEGGDAALTSAMASAEAVPLTPPAPAATAPKAAALSAFGEIGKQVDRQDIIDRDTVFIRFENGVRLTIKPTKLQDGEVTVKVRVGGNSPAPDWALAALVDGTAAKATQVANAIDLSTTTTRDDLEDSLRLLAGPVVNPTWSPETLERARGAAHERFDDDDASAAGVLARDLPSLLSGRQPWVAPDRASIDEVSLANLRCWTGPILASGPLDVTIAGDITIEKATDAVAATFAALPTRPPSTAIVDFAVPTPFANPSTAPLNASHAGRADDGKALMAWLTENPLVDSREARRVQVLAAALQARLNQTGLQAYVRNSASLPGTPWEYLILTIDGAPGALPGLLAQAGKTVADLRARDISADELARAKASVSQAEETLRKSNVHWLDLLSGAQEDPRRLTVIRSQEAAVDRVSAADVRAAAQRYLRDGAALRFTVRPAGS